MKKVSLALIIVLAFASIGMAQITTPTSDVLGAHLNYGRGCAACHAPHSGAWGNGANASGDTKTGEIALWGQDVGNLYGKQITTGQSEHGNYVETLPSTWDSTRPDTANVLTCLSCHDGNYAQGAMMKNQVYETLPSSYGTFNKIPTLLGNDGNAKGDYLNDHPVGLNAVFGCGGQYNWDCTINANGTVAMTGPASSAFVTNYGFFVSLNAYNNTPVVTCTTCHNQHVMNVVKVTTGPKSGLPSGTYTTMFFLRAPYNPGTTTAGANQTAQFCRQCHGGESNEMNGGLTIPTTF